MGSSNGKYNGNGKDPEHGDQEHRVIEFPSLAERDRIRREKLQAEADAEAGARLKNKARQFKEPLINLPPATKFLVVSLLAIHVLTALILSPIQQYWVWEHFGFVPGKYTGALPFDWSALAGPFTYMFVHGNWLHVILNGVMLMAFGAGIERWMGGRRLLVFIVACSVVSAFFHMLLNMHPPQALNPVVGASGGISGLFAAILVMMQQMGSLYSNGPQVRLMPFIILWVVITIVFGMMGSPDGSNIAWAAHIGGFLAGFALLKPIMKYVP